MRDRERDRKFSGERIVIYQQRKARERIIFRRTDCNLPNTNGGEREREICRERGGRLPISQKDIDLLLLHVESERDFLMSTGANFQFDGR